MAAYSKDWGVDVLGFLTAQLLHFMLKIPQER
jgi:hypothetical protein